MNRKQIFGLFLYIIGFTLIIIILIPIFILIINYIEGNVFEEEDGGIFLYYLFGFLANLLMFVILITLKGFFFIKPPKTAREKKNFFIKLIVIGLIIIGINIIAIYGTIICEGYSATILAILFIPCMIFAACLICYESNKVLSYYKYYKTTEKWKKKLQKIGRKNHRKMEEKTKIEKWKKKLK